MLSSFIGKSGPSSAQLQMEMIRQLGEINSQLVKQTEILAKISKEISEIPEKAALFDAKTLSTSTEGMLEKIFNTLQPEGIKVSDPLSHYYDLVNEFENVERGFFKIRSIMIHTKNIDHALVELSYPIISLAQNYTMLAQIMCFPSFLVQHMNEDDIRLVTDFSPDPTITTEELQSIIKTVRDFYKEIMDEYGSSYMSKLVQEIVSYADSGGSIPGKLNFSGCGYRQHRYKTLFRGKTWATHRTKFSRSIEVASEFGPVHESTTHDPFEFGIVINGDTARKTWREPYDNMKVKFRARAGNHMSAQGLAASIVKSFLSSNKELVKKDPYNYAGIGGLYSQYHPSQKEYALAQAYYLENWFRGQQIADLAEFKRLSGMDKSYSEASERLAIYLYMTGLLHFISETSDALGSMISDWEEREIFRPIARMRML